MNRWIRSVGALALVLLLAAAACGDPAPDAADTEGTPGPTPDDAQMQACPAGTEIGTKPEVETPGGDPPAELVTEDLRDGDGEEASEGDQVCVHYVGVAWSTGTEFDNSWDRGMSFGPIQLGAGMVIPGWDQGLQGMREGGQRRLVIPPDLAYGEMSPSPDIGPNETLIFVVDLVEVR